MQADEALSIAKSFLSSWRSNGDPYAVFHKAYFVGDLKNIYILFIINTKELKGQIRNPI